MTAWKRRPTPRAKVPFVAMDDRLGGIEAHAFIIVLFFKRKSLTLALKDFSRPVGVYPAASWLNF